METDPAAGTAAEEGSVVELKVSKGGKPVTVPDVVGTTSSEATKTLQDAGFKVNLVSVPSDQPAGTVVAQNPKPGGTAKQGTIVRLNVAKSAGETTPGTTAPAATATVPDVVGKELADGARKFADEGLKVDVRYVPSREAAGRIVAQSRPAGTELEQGDTVQLNVSEGANPQAATSVPDVTGLDADRRAEAARRRRLRGARARHLRPQPHRPRALADAERRREHPARLARDPLRRRLSSDFRLGLDLVADAVPRLEKGVP